MPSLGMEDIDRNAGLYIEMDNLNVKNHKKVWRHEKTKHSNIETEIYNPDILLISF
jgi:hypothetical protein